MPHTLAQMREIFNFGDFLLREVVASRTLKLGEQTVRVKADGTTGALVITLPNVSEAIGLTFSIYAQTADVTNTVTVQDQNESEGWSDVVLNDDDEGVVVRSDGIRWVTSGSFLVQAAIADIAAPTAYSAHTSGATPVTSNAATDLDTTAAAVATLVTELTATNAKLNALLLALETAGILES